MATQVPSPQTSPQTPPRRPRLSLQIKTSCSPATRSSRSYAVDPKDPTALNTLSNVYMTAVSRATPEPLTAINTLQSFSLSTPIEPQQKDSKPKLRVVTPYVTSYPETPLSANASTPPKLDIPYPSVMTATPPLSAGPVDPGSQVFTFAKTETSSHQSITPPSLKLKIQTPVRRMPPRVDHQLPYTHPRSLHSILRNSPLPPTSSIPASPRRQSRRLQEKAAKKVGYNNPLTQEIVTNKYTKSHIDLLVEEASPMVSPGVQVQPEVMDISTAFQPNEIEDGGQTPGPFEEMRRRMAGLGAGSPGSSPGGIRKRKRKEKKRRWVWTIGQDDDDDDVGGAIAAIRAEAARAKGKPVEESNPSSAPVPAITFCEVPTPSIESTDSGSDSFDVEMSDSSSCVSDERGLTPCEMDLDTHTPIAPRKLSEELGVVKRDTPIPPELVMT